MSLNKLKVARRARSVLLQYCPVRTGRMKRSITLHRTSDGFNLGARVYYAPYVRRYHDAVARAATAARAYAANRGFFDVTVVVDNTEIIIG